VAGVVLAYTRQMGRKDRQRRIVMKTFGELLSSIRFGPANQGCLIEWHGDTEVYASVVLAEDRVCTDARRLYIMESRYGCGRFEYASIRLEGCREIAYTHDGIDWFSTNQLLIPAEATSW
jgi:hypothetical protein